MVLVHSNGHKYIKGGEKPNASKTASPPPKKKTGKNPKSTQAKIIKFLYQYYCKEKFHFFLNQSAIKKARSNYRRKVN